jgi:hypothetical protein
VNPRVEIIEASDHPNHAAYLAGVRTGFGQFAVRFSFLGVTAMSTETTIKKPDRFYADTPKFTDEAVEYLRQMGATSKPAVLNRIGARVDAAYPGVSPATRAELVDSEYRQWVNDRNRSGNPRRSQTMREKHHKRRLANA